jgi:hypothetical protein
VVEGLQIDPKDQGLRSILESMLRDSQAVAERSKKEAMDLDADARADETFGQGLQKEREAARLRRAGRSDAATRSFWAAADRFGAAATQSRLIAEEEEQDRLKQQAQERAAPKPSAKDQAAPKPPPLNPEMERELVIPVLRRYEAAYASLSPAALRSVYPSVSGEQLRELTDSRSYTVTLKVEDLKFGSGGGRTWVTVPVQVTRDVVPKSGARTHAEQAQVVTLEKLGTNWVIVSVR